MECPVSSEVVHSKAAINIPVRPLLPKTNLCHLGNIVLPPNVTSARVLKLPPGYVILKDAQGSFKGLARVPIKITNPISPQRKESPEDQLPKQKPSIAMIHPMSLPTQGLQPVQQHLRDEINPLDENNSDLSILANNIPGSSFHMPVNTLAAARKNPSPSVNQGTASTSQRPLNETPPTSEENPILTQPQRANSKLLEAQKGVPMILKNNVPIQPRGPLPRQPWTRDPPNWKKEPIVLYSGAPLNADDTTTEKPNEDEKPKSGRGKKLPPPQSLPCPKKLADILPKNSYKYHISSFEELSNPAQFKAEIRVNIVQKETALQWLQEFEEISGTNFRTAKTYKEKSLRLIYKKTFRCHKNTFRKVTVKKETERHVGCQARLSITVKNPEMKMSSDALLSEFPCVIGIYHNHCHSLTTLDSLRYRRPTPKLREKFATMFKAGISPSAALRLHKLDLEKEYGDKYPEVSNDAAKCPLLPWCYKVYYDVCKKKVKDGKKKSNRRSNSSKKKNVVAIKNQVMVETTEQSSKAVADFDSEYHRNVSHVEDSVSISAPVTLSSNHLLAEEGHNKFDNQCGEVQSSVNSLYQYEYMSENPTRENDLMECENVDGLVNNNQILISDGNFSHQDVLLSPENDEDFHDSSEVLQQNDHGHFEDSCENQDDGIRSDDTLSKCLNSVANTADLEGIQSKEVNKAAEHLEQIFNNLRKKLLDEPGKYLSAVQKFVSNFGSLYNSDNPFDLNQALSDFGCKNSSSSIMPLTVSKKGLPKIVENLVDSRKNSTGGLDSSKHSRSPKRKVLVLRMDPNRFNKILGKVSAHQSKRDVGNIM